MLETQSTELVHVLEEHSLEDQTKNQIQNGFKSFFERFEELKDEANKIQVTDVLDFEGMSKAREFRLKLVKVRTEANQTRKDMKAESLRYGKAVQGVYNIIEYMVKPIEEHLMKQEKFGEIKAAERKEELRQKRIAELTPYEEFVPVGIDFGAIPEDEYMKVFNGAKMQHEDKLETERKAEAERKEKERKHRQHCARYDLLSEENLLNLVPSHIPTDLSDLTQDEFKALQKSLREEKAEQEEIKRKKQLHQERFEKVSFAGLFDYIFHDQDFGGMTAEEFSSLYEKAFSEKKADEEKQRKENERIENARKKAEAAAAEDRRLREEAEAKVREAEEKKRKEEEDRIRAEEQKAAEAERLKSMKAQQADAELLKILSDHIKDIKLPAMRSKAGKNILQQVSDRLTGTTQVLDVDILALKSKTD